MKILDEKGRLFQKVNLIDAIVVVLLAAVVISIGWKVVSTKLTAAAEARETPTYATSPHLLYRVVCKDQPIEVAEAFEAQMERPQSDRQIMNAGISVDGYITDCTYTQNDDGNCDVYFTIESTFKEKDGIYTVGTQEVRIGKGHIVKTYTIETSGFVYSMEVVNNG